MNQWAGSAVEGLTADECNNTQNTREHVRKLPTLLDQSFSFHITVFHACHLSPQLASFCLPEYMQTTSHIFAQPLQSMLLALKSCLMQSNPANLLVPPLATTASCASSAAPYAPITSKYFGIIRLRRAAARKQQRYRRLRPRRLKQDRLKDSLPLRDCSDNFEQALRTDRQ